jgi:prophage regulatory protein
MIKNNGPIESLPPLNGAPPPLPPDGGDRTPDEPRARRMLTEREVLRLVPISRATLWRREREGTFPKGSYISPNRKIWFEDEVCAWQHAIEGQGRGRRNQRSLTR